MPIREMLEDTSRELREAYKAADDLAKINGWAYGMGYCQGVMSSLADRLDRYLRYTAPNRKGATDCND